MAYHTGGVLGRRLFERLAVPEQAEVAVGEPDLGETVESIKRHLVDLLNSHPGHSECAPALGLLDFNDATIGVLDLELSIQRAIRQCIERFEPRVSRVEVESVPNHGDPLQLHFQVHATLALGRENAQTTIDLLLNNKRYQCLD
ncbi:type VI secretion system baseplate subunit TssE [Halomonas sp. ML-15]|uniref:type VI secretion system baseplate subunit TssE n=1 Tax=Halomonas sp. ML-15 TaxID=2773305 RepID=UPI00174624D2|nr:type VI secretion system baseplate subunit TssE [Halomonas sp. ML-15]MBD3896013.1 type VI secretion system baseplate subunit TssE [Halomonas sp. ML-15]